jgi:hypothetical protein
MLRIHVLCLDSELEPGTIATGPIKNGASRWLKNSAL